jgi:hypothetical protein
MTDQERAPIVDRIVQRLVNRFPDAPRPRVLDIVGEEYDALDQGKIRAYIPPLVEHSARNRLQREFTPTTPQS